MKRSVADISARASRFALVLGVILLAGCDFRMWREPQIPGTFSSNGERIYFTGRSSSGNPIRATDPVGHMGMHRRMHGGGCASCHGADREGIRLMPFFWRKTPALTAQTLFGGGESDGDGLSGHGHEHVYYTLESLGRAITDGVNPSGGQLDPDMPRWTMSARDLDDLVSYLQSDA